MHTCLERRTKPNEGSWEAFPGKRIHDSVSMEATAHPKWQRELTERGWERKEGKKESAISFLPAEQGGRAGGKWLLQARQGNVRGHRDIWSQSGELGWAQPCHKLPGSLWATHTRHLPVPVEINN